MPALSSISTRLVALGVWLAACSHEPGADERSLLLVTLDTTRPDALSCYGGPATPNLEALAREGVVFDRARASTPITLPSHSTIFSGLYPLRHGVRDNGRNPLPESARTLAEVAHDAGYQTAAFVGAVVLDRAFGLGQGFERYDAPSPPAPGAHEGPPQEAERPAREVVDGALAWLRSRDPARPFFLWVHIYDPHTPYQPPPEFDGTTARAKYDGEVRSADRELGRLFDDLRSQGVLDRTLVLVAGDHGEAFGEHGERGHSAHCYETTLRVPLLVRAPFWTRLAAGSRSNELVALVDLLPTACEALGLPAPGGLDGQSFWGRPPAAERGVYFESYYGFLNFGWSPIAGWFDARGKYLHSSDARFFDVAADPGEERDLLGERADDVRRAQHALVELAELSRLEVDTAQTTEELLGALRGLGYASVGAVTAAMPHPLEPSDLPSPESMREAYEKSVDALELGRRGQVADAERLFREVVAVNPRNPFVLEQLATCQGQLGKFPEAEATLHSVLALGVRTPGIWHKLAVCLEQQQKPGEAIDALQEALDLDPRRTQTRVELARLLRAAGRAAEAQALESGTVRPAGGG